MLINCIVLDEMFGLMKVRVCSLPRLDLFVRYWYIQAECAYIYNNM